MVVGPNAGNKSMDTPVQCSGNFILGQMHRISLTRIIFTQTGPMTVFRLCTLMALAQTMEKQNAQAGYGVFWGDGHPDNESGPLPGRATNNRAEFFAAICAIEQALERGLEALVVRTDSELLVKSLTKYIFTWRCNNWTTYNGSPLRNKDFLKRLNKLMRQIDVQFEHVDAHCGDYGNDQADYFARQGARIRIKYHR